MGGEYIHGGGRREVGREAPKDVADGRGFRREPDGSVGGVTGGRARTRDRLRGMCRGGEGGGDT
jgi:hypothetical protein